MPGDFGLPRKTIARTQIVAIYDLVDYTGLDSNQDLVLAVQMLEGLLSMALANKFEWGARGMDGNESDANELLLRSTGDGYVVAFSQGMDDFAALELLSNIHSSVQIHHSVRLGINKGENYVVGDVNPNVNVVGWGINLAARALAFAEGGQIMCTEHFAKPLIATKKSLAKVMKSVGIQRVKNSKMEMYNYYKKDAFGAQLMPSQKNPSALPVKKTRVAKRPKKGS